MNIQEYIDKMTLEKIEDRLSFNDISESDFKLFKDNFLNISEKLQIDYLIKIIEETDESNLTSGNFQEFFDDLTIKELLLKCI